MPMTVSCGFKLSSSCAGPVLAQSLLAPAAATNASAQVQTLAVRQSVQQQQQLAAVPAAAAGLPLTGVAFGAGWCVRLMWLASVCMYLDSFGSSAVSCTGLCMGGTSLALAQCCARCERRSSGRFYRGSR